MFCTISLSFYLIIAYFQCFVIFVTGAKRMSVYLSIIPAEPWAPTGRLGLLISNIFYLTIIMNQRVA